MRKRVINRWQADTTIDETHWLDLSLLASVEVTSEDASHPIESALLIGDAGGWRASLPGEQIIRLIFDEPQRIGLIKLLFVEEERARTQQFVLRWLPNNKLHYQEILRQQYNFAPPESAQESESYATNLADVVALELSIIPDLSGGEARASLASLRLAEAS
jgi:hypothetical protein